MIAGPWTEITIAVARAYIQSWRSARQEKRIRKIKQLTNENVINLDDYRRIKPLRKRG